MNAFKTHTGLVVPLDRANVDTDQIIPKQFLKSIKRTGFGPNLFDEWRYLDVGEPGEDSSTRPLNPDFVLNLPRYAGASVLLARENFGCGSSREHAPWALLDFGIRAVIATRIADIFRSNALKNGLLPIEVTDDAWQRVAAFAGREIAIDLQAQQVELGDEAPIAFTIEPFARECLLRGVDQLGYLLSQSDAIAAFEAAHA